MTNKNLKFFKVLYQSKKRGSRARLGEIVTAHGKIKTPSFVAVGTKGTVKSILPSLLKEIGTQVAFVNTYHLVTHPGVEVIEKAGGIHQYASLNLPLMSDSGGFQIFSLAKSKNLGSKFLSSVNSSPSKLEGSSNIHFRNNFSPSFFDQKPALIKISDDGVRFRSVFDGTVLEFTPEKSIEYQKKIGADMIMAFDECISYGVSYEYTKKATERTHRWLIRCITKVKSQKSKVKTKSDLVKTKTQNYKTDQYLYGVIQGGVFEDLRKKSAEFVVSQNTDGVAIGGVSVGESKKEMRDQVAWVSPFLPENRPVHLLGVGEFDDILDLVRYGIDTFDCVEPTRLARMGIIYKNEKIKNKKDNEKIKIKKIDILKGIYRNDLSKVDNNCDCFVCQHFTKSYLHHLFKNRELLAYTLATYHNLFVMEKFFSWIRKMIERDLI